VTPQDYEYLRKLLKERSGLDLSADFPELGQSALYCVTELHTAQDLETLATALAEVLG